MSQPPPHLVFFVADQWRGNVLGHAGNPAAVTPCLDELVKTDAISLVRTFCQNPVCTPSRCSFMTGWYPHVRGHRTIDHPLQPGEPCLLSELRQAGYFVWWGGKNDLVTDPAAFRACCDYRHQASVTHHNLHGDQSWRKIIDGRRDNSFFAGRLQKHPGESIYLDSDWSHVEGAVSFLKSCDPDKPFCLFLCLESPHPPYGVEDPYFSRIDRSALPPRIKGADTRGKSQMETALRLAFNLHDRPETWWNELRATYYGMCARVDAQVGRITAALRETGLFDNTALFFFSDHGDFAGDYDLVEKAQNVFDDCLVRVPFIFKPPASRSCAPGLRHGLVELVDFPATVYDLAGIQPGYTHFGRSLLHLLPADEPHRPVVFSSGGRLKTDTHCTEMGPGGIDPDGLYSPRIRVQASDHVAHGKALMCRDAHCKLISRLYEPGELYDLRADPGETLNRIDDPALASVRDRLSDETRRFLLETTDVVPRAGFPRDV